MESALKRLHKIYLKLIDSKMVKWVVWMSLFLPGILMATYDQQGQAFGEEMLNQGFGDAEGTLNQMSSEWSKQPGNHAGQTEELKSSFESSYDSGKKGEDPLKGYFSQKTVEISKNKTLNQPSVGDAELLLKQKHRFKISPDDPLFKKQKEICDADIETEGVFQKEQPAVKAPALKDKIVACRIGSAGIEKSCVKKRVIHLTSPSIRTLSVVLAVRAFHQVTFTINFASNTISLVHDYPSDTDYKPNPLTILNKDGIIGWSGVSQGLDNAADVSQINFTGSDNGSATVLRHPSPSNGYVGVVRFAPAGSYMQVLKVHLSWQVVGYPNLGPDTFEGCEDLERQAVDGSCEIISAEQQGLNKTRILPNYPTPVTREYWSEAKTFNCGAGRDIDTCKTLLDQGCEQIDSQCAETRNGFCIEYENTFKCKVPDYLKGDGLAFKNGQLSFMKGPAPYHEGYDAADFGQAVTQFNALTEMGKKLQDELGGILGDPDNPSVFHGKCSQCRITIGSFFRDCCKLKGILQGLFGQCNEEEKKLAVAAIKNQRCVKVGGRYCHKKLKPFGCAEKRDSYCCYGSKLARIIQEIAHYQLNIRWGSEEHPNCSPLTAEQLSQIDFDTPYAQEKLSEILAEVQATAQEKFELVQNAAANMGNVQSKIDDLKEKQDEAFYKQFADNGAREDSHYNEIRQQTINQAEKHRKLKKIKEYQAFEKELNVLEDRLGMTKKSYGIPKEGTSDQDLLHWHDNVGEAGVDAHIEVIYKPRLKQYESQIKQEQQKIALENRITHYQSLNAKEKILFLMEIGYPKGNTMNPKDPVQQSWVNSLSPEQDNEWVKKLEFLLYE